MTHTVRDGVSDVTPPLGMAARAVAGLDVEALRAAIRAEYAVVAAEPARGFHFHTGRPLARLLGYDDAWLAGIPEPTIASFAGTGNPFVAGPLSPGERVVDVGCGAGIDSLIAARLVGPDGVVVGVDMTPTMLDRARRSADQASLGNVAFHEGLAEALPVPDEWADIVISNGVLNLMPDKAAALAEMARVLRPGGRLQIGDILVQKAVPDGAKRDIDLWKGWIAGALLEAELHATVVASGFTAFLITSRLDVFRDAPQASSAAAFGTLGITFSARKARDAEEWQRALAELTCRVEGLNP